MPDHRSQQSGGSRLSPQTLVVASLASLTAAIVTSTFWRNGTPITAAITPVIVAIASELYSRPAEKITALGSRAAAASRTGRTREHARDSVTVPPRPLRLQESDEPDLGPVRVYRSETSGRRRVRLKLALVTAAIAFAIAVAVLTLPELVFGGSVASHGKTTFFGGGRSHKGKTSTSPATSPSRSHTTTTTPSQTTSTPSSPPAQTAPQSSTPSTSPAGGTQTPTTPAQTPPGH